MKYYLVRFEAEVVLSAYSDEHAKDIINSFGEGEDINDHIQTAFINKIEVLKEVTP